MTLSRFKRRKLAARTHESSTILRTSIKRADLLHLDDIGIAILECASCPDEEVAKHYSQIGDWLHANVTRLNLDENTTQIIDFAKRLAGELLDGSGRLHWFSSNSCWDQHSHSQSPWFSVKIDGKNAVRDDEWGQRSVADQKTVMTDMALLIWESDPTLRAGALALRQHQDSRQLLHEKFKDYID